MAVVVAEKEDRESEAEPSRFDSQEGSAHVRTCLQPREVSNRMENIDN